MEKLLAKFTSLNKRAKVTLGVVGVVVLLGVVAVALGAAGVVDTGALFGASSPKERCARVCFTKITVHDDADPLGSGELDFRLRASWGYKDGGLSAPVGSRDLWTKDWHSDTTHSINECVERCWPISSLAYEDAFVVRAVGLDDDTLPDENDSLGQVWRTYTAEQDWGKGSHSEKSDCPDGCFSVDYTIDVWDK